MLVRAEKNDSGLLPRRMLKGSTDKHFIFSISFINGLRRGSDENFEAAPKARHNRSNLARRFYYSRLNEGRGLRHLAVRLVNRAADERNLVARRESRIADKQFQFAYFVFDDRQGFREVARRSRKMAGHDLKLLGDFLALGGDLLSLLAQDRNLLHKRFDALFETIDGLDGAADEDCDGNHRGGDYEKRNGDDDQHPEGRIVCVHLESRENRQRSLSTSYDENAVSRFARARPRSIEGN